MMVSVKDAANMLGVRPGTLRRYCRQGMPHQPGRKGRGRAVMVDPAAAQQWIRGSPDDRLALMLAGELPRLVADAIFQEFQNSGGPHKRALAGALAGVWYSLTVTLLDYLRERNSKVPDFDGRVPTGMEHLCKIARND